ncbi:MAG: diguanylate cyclase [Omnitrophica WOR_2 bacterium]
MKDRIKVLLIDDDEDEYILLRSLVSQTSENSKVLIDIHWVGTYEAALKSILSKEYDAYLVDYHLGARTGLDLIYEATKQEAREAFILLTGESDYEVDLAAMEAGAADFLVKSDVNFRLLERSIRYAIDRKRAQNELELRVQERTLELTRINRELRKEIAERKTAQEAYKQSQARFQKLADTTSAAIFIVQDQKIRYANMAATYVTGYDNSELIRMQFWQLAHPSYQGIARQRKLGMQWNPEVPARYELKLRTKGAVERWVDITEGEIDFDGTPALLLTAFDITERDTAEHELEKAKAQLEERVAKRTAELQDTNDRLSTTYQHLAEINARLGEANQQLLYDLNERETLLEKIQKSASEARMRATELNAIFTSLAETVIVYDAEGIALQANPMAVEVLGLNPVGLEREELAARINLRNDNGNPILPGESPADKALHGEIVRNERYTFTNKSGQKLWVSASASPLYHQGHIFGAVMVWHDITDRELMLEQIRRNTARAEILGALSKAFAEAGLDYQAVLNTVARRISDLLGDAVIIRLLSQDGQWLDTVAYYGDPHKSKSLKRTIKTSRIPAKDGWAAQIIGDNLPIYLPEITPEMIESKQVTIDWPLMETYPVKSALIVPLRASNRAIGTLSVFRFKSGNPFVSEDVKFFLIAGERAALAIENARLHKEMVHMAKMDALTELYNRRSLLELGKREIERCHRFGRTLSVIMLDIDHFKQVNDTYGHSAGDQVLRVLADRCQSQIRKVDILGRYGGEEFVIFLPETPLEAAKEVAERLREAMENEPIMTDQGEIRTSISLGLAAGVKDIADLNEVLRQADTALYQAKQSGRNRVVAV